MTILDLGIVSNIYDATSTGIATARETAKPASNFRVHQDLASMRAVGTAAVKLYLKHWLRLTQHTQKNQIISHLNVLYLPFSQRTVAILTAGVL